MAHRQKPSAATTDADGFQTVGPKSRREAPPKLSVPKQPPLRYAVSTSHGSTSTVPGGAEGAAFDRYLDAQMEAFLEKARVLFKRYQPNATERQCNDAVVAARRKKLETNRANRGELYKAYLEMMATANDYEPLSVQVVMVSPTNPLPSA